MNSPSFPPPLRGAGKPFSSQAALFSLLAALVGVTINFAFAAALANPSDKTSASGQRMTGALAALFFLLGFVFGWVALRGAGRHGGRGTFGLGLGCVLLNGVLLGTTALGMVNGKNQLLARKAAMNSSEEQGDSGSSNVNAAKLEQLRQELEKASRELSRDEGRLARTWASYLSKLQMITGEYNRSLESLRQAEVLDLETLHTTVQLQARREVVEKFLSANESYKEFQTNAEKKFRDGLLNLKISPAETERALGALQTRIRESNPFALQDRSVDSRWGHAMLGIIDLLESRWDAWEYDQATGAISFDDDEDATRYEALLDIFEAAAEEHTAARQKGITPANGSTIQ